MNYTIVHQEDFITNEWSGGTTTQFAIYPKDATLANRDFKWRLSSAKFTSTSSVFSDFSGYQRYLLSLQGELFVNHEGLYERTLFPFDVEYFLGNWTTKSTNSLDCVDFNFIVQKDLGTNLAVLKEDDSYATKRTGQLIIFTVGDCELYIRTTEKKHLNLKARDLLIIEEEDVFNSIKIIHADKPVIVCEVF